VAATAELFSQDPSVREVDVAIEGSAPPVNADPKMLQIVFQNLLLNAAHAMDGRGRINVSVKASQADCHISFADAGPGIPPEVRGRIFTPFFTTKTRGSGLGLPTAKRLIDAHNGHISIDCPPGAGTTVVIRLPIATA
jgi:signal transduction histidine kinase